MLEKDLSTRERLVIGKKGSTCPWKQERSDLIKKGGTFQVNGKGVRRNHVGWHLFEVKDGTSVLRRIGKDTSDSSAYLICQGSPEKPNQYRMCIHR